MTDSTDLLSSPGTSAALSLGASLEGRFLSTIDDVLATMAFIDANVSEQDGLKWFNTLYALVTARVQQDVKAGRFQNPAWIERLDVIFARLFFEAVSAYDKDPKLCARAWRPFFGARYNTQIARLQFALAGMNAHINHDLALAVVETCAATDTEPKRETSIFADYEAVNQILEDVEVTAVQTLATGLIREAEIAMGRVDDIIAMWSIRHARDTAWTNAELLWALRGNELLYETFVGTMDRMAGYAGRGLLVPLGLGGGR